MRVKELVDVLITLTPEEVETIRSELKSHDSVKLQKVFKGFTRLASVTQEVRNSVKFKEKIDAKWKSIKANTYGGSDEECGPM